MQGDILDRQLEVTAKKAKINNLEFAGLHIPAGQKLPGSDSLKTLDNHKWEANDGSKPNWETLGEDFIYINSPSVDLSTVLKAITWCNPSDSSTYKIKTS